MPSIYCIHSDNASGSPARLCYVGSTSRDPHQRYKEHKWQPMATLRELLEGAHVFRVLETCDTHRRYEREAFHIERMRWDGWHVLNRYTPNTIPKSDRSAYLKAYKARWNRRKECARCGKSVMAAGMAMHQRSEVCQLVGELIETQAALAVAVGDEGTDDDESHSI